MGGGAFLAELRSESKLLSHSSPPNAVCVLKPTKGEIVWQSAALIAIFSPTPLILFLLLIISVSVVSHFVLLLFFFARPLSALYLPTATTNTSQLRRPTPSFPPARPRTVTVTLQKRRRGVFHRDSRNTAELKPSPRAASESSALPLICMIASTRRSHQSEQSACTLQR